MVVQAFSFHKPVMQSFEPAAKWALYARTAAWTTTTTVACAALKLVANTVSNQKAGRPLFAMRLSVNTLSIVKIIAAVVIGALVFYQVEFRRGMNAFQRELALKEDLTPKEFQCLVKNPSAVKAALENNSTPTHVDALLHETEKEDQFRSFKAIVDHLAENNTQLTVDQLIQTFPAPTFTSYVLRTKKGLPILSNTDIVKCWQAVKTDVTAKAFVAHKHDINTKDETGNSALIYALSSDLFDQARLLIRHGATLDLDGCSPATIQFIKLTIGHKLDYEVLFLGNKDVQTRIFNNLT